MAYVIPLPTSLPEPTGMHIPDGFVSAPVAAAGYVAASFILAIAIRRTNRHFRERQAPLMGVTAAFIFAAQMMNFPVAGGTSGHLLGATLATVLLGPWAAMIVMTCVVGVQALIFQDGGLSALGLNIFNMGIAPVILSSIVYQASQLFGRGGRSATCAGSFAAAWLSVEVAAGLTALELAYSDTSPVHIVLPSMVGVHALIGIGEGLITVAALAFVMSTRSDLLPHPRGRPALEID
jgi:cobalt/nickel transport system permease protein